MKKYLVIPALALIICLSGAFNGFCQYYDLDGKWVQINGPQKWKIIGVALDELTCDKLIAASEAKDQGYFTQLLKNYDVFRIPNGSSALVLDVKLFEGKAQVMVFKTIYERESGWIPISWLDGNQDRPGIKNIVGNRLTSKRIRNSYLP